MKKLLPLVLMLIAVAIAVPMLRNHGQNPMRDVTGLPWQIEVLPDGTSRVFGLTLGESTMEDAVKQLGPDMESAIIAAAGEDGAFEMYYSRYTAGILTGKLILAADLPTDTLVRLREHARKSEYMESGARKFLLDPDDLPTALQAPIASITFIPAVDIDEDVALQRFGTPAERLRLSDQIEHFLYPAKGLDLILNRKGKEVLQYVAPRDFGRLRAPLLKQQQDEKHAAAHPSPKTH